MNRRVQQLDTIANFEDARELARRCLPRGVFDYLDGGADAETTLRRNSEVLREIGFRPRAGVVNPSPTLRTTVLGTEIAMPLMTAPVGGMRIVDPDGDLAIARAAKKAEIVYVEPSSPGFTIETLAAAHAAPTWLQVYEFHEIEVMERLVERARAAGTHALVLSIDTHLQGKRERDVHNKFSPSWQMNLKTLSSDARSVAMRPRWAYRYLRAGRPVALSNSPLFTVDGVPLLTPERMKAAATGKTATFDDVGWIRANWDGPIVIKGLVSPDDARRAVDLGANAVMVSNYGGRSLDGEPAAIEALPEIVEAVGDQVEIFFDGGVQRGGEIVKALALGARAVLVGRLLGYGLAIAGQTGVERMIEMLHQDLVRTLRLLGCTSVHDLDPSWIRTPRS